MGYGLAEEFLAKHSRTFTMKIVASAERKDVDCHIL